MVAFNNTYTANVSQAYVSCIAAAEQFISSQWTDSITINLAFDAQFAGTNTFLAHNNWPAFVNVDYTRLRTALVAHANNPDAQAAIATLPVTDPTISYAGNHLWSLPEAYARMLGLSSDVYTPDDTITLNLSFSWNFGQDVINALEHEITEGGMGRVGGLGDQNHVWSTLDLFRWAVPSTGGGGVPVRDFTDGRDGRTTYFSVDGNRMLLPYNNQYNGTFQVNTGDTGDFSVFDVFGFGQVGNTSITFSATDYRVMNALGWTSPTSTITVGPLIVSASGDFDGNGIPDFIWRRTNDAAMGMWSYDGGNQIVTTTALGVVDFNWAVLGSAIFTPGTNRSQMLMDYVPTGLMTVWWVDNGQLTGINLGQRWINVGYVATGPFTNNGGPVVTDFLVSNLTDRHLYDWWIGSNNTLQGIDLGPYWSNVSLVATGQFTDNGIKNLLVSNTLDHHLYDWWISGNTLQGIDLGPVWSNVAFVSSFFAAGHSGFLVANTLDHHLYHWWIGSNNALQGIDLGLVWSNAQLVTTGQFDNNTTGAEMLVQNTVDHHLYEWWITSQGQLTGVDLGPYWSNVQLVGRGSYNNRSVFQELLVRNTTDGHSYEWWIANNQLAGVDLGAVGGMGGTATVATAGGDPSSVAAAAAAPLATSAATTSGSGAMSPPADGSLLTPSSDSTSLLVQSMASFGASGAVADSTGAVLTAGLAHLSEIVAPIDRRASHS